MPDPEPKLEPIVGRVGAEAARTQLIEFFNRYEAVTVLTGAGCSTGSGIPDYRDDAGNWKHRKPVQLAEFVSNPATRQRYWAQSFSGWQRIEKARPNNAHVALARLEQAGRVRSVITQNVDNLHRRAGSRNIIDLHGILHRIRCLGCGAVRERTQFQERLAALNPDWVATVSEFAPDGDTRLSRTDFHAFSVPACDACDGILKPDVVFFGEAVPAQRVTRASDFLRQTDALLVTGSSLMVFSGFRFARLASTLGKPIAILNRGKTRADEFAACKLEHDCGTILSGVAEWFDKEMTSDARGLDRRL